MPVLGEREKLILRLVIARIVIKTLSGAMTNSSSLSEKDFEILNEAQRLDALLVKGYNQNAVANSLKKLIKTSEERQLLSKLLQNPKLNKGETNEPKEIISPDDITALENYNKSPEYNS